MNERTIQLYKQAVDFAYTTAGKDAGKGTIIESLTAGKFAELIVRECAEIALEQKKWVEDMKVHNPEDEVWNRARIQQSQHIVDKIKQHFGVEE